MAELFMFSAGRLGQSRREAKLNVGVTLSVHFSICESAVNDISINSRS